MLGTSYNVPWILYRRQRECNKANQTCSKEFTTFLCVLKKKKNIPFQLRIYSIVFIDMVIIYPLTNLQIRFNATSNHCSTVCCNILLCKQERYVSKHCYRHTICSRYGRSTISNFIRKRIHSIFLLSVPTRAPFVSSFFFLFLFISFFFYFFVDQM